MLQSGDRAKTTSAAEGTGSRRCSLAATVTEGVEGRGERRLPERDGLFGRLLERRRRVHAHEAGAAGRARAANTEGGSRFLADDARIDATYDLSTDRRPDAGPARRFGPPADPSHCRAGGGPKRPRVFRAGSFDNAAGGGVQCVPLVSGPRRCTALGME